MRKLAVIFIILFAILVLFSGGVLLFWDDIVVFYSEFSLKLPQIEKGVTNIIQEAEKQISTPEPLRAVKETEQAFLTKTGVINWTNIQREKYGLPPFRENPKLDLSAAIKVEDMFNNQYFAHYSSTGVGVKDLAESASYEFIAIGENLALGNFENDEALVQAWMDSPGHRANILNTKYQEIGVAVDKGIFEGKSTWLAVQHFGLPLSSCPEPSEALKEEIEINQNKILELEQTLKILQIEIKKMRPRNREDYYQIVDQYNNLVNQYNTLVQDTEILVNKYNNQVKSFNECASGQQ